MINLFEIRDLISKKFPKEKENLAYVLAYIEALKYLPKYDISKTNETSMNNEEIVVLQT